jgi:hypothetical protein
MNETAVKWLIERVEDADITEDIWEIVKSKALELEKEQAKRMYTEEEVFSIIDKAFHMYASSYRHDAKEWFKQFKKK